MFFLSKGFPDNWNMYRKAFLFIVLLKLILGTLFSSGYENGLFMPFVEHFITHLDNPWQYFYGVQVDQFPYPPLMLYILSFFSLPYFLFAYGNIIAQNLCFKIPTFLADLSIFCVLLRIFPKRTKEILIFYFGAPVILYGAYMHSQLDLIPMAFLVAAIYLLVRNKLIYSALFFGLAISLKFHVAAVIPLVLIYILKNHNVKYCLLYILIPAGVYVLLAAPFILSEGFYYMVLCNPKQMSLFETFFAIGSLKIYLPVFAAIAIYARFFAYRKVNRDLFYAFSGILFSVFVLLIFPAPAWYIWMLPFISLFFIKHSESHSRIIYLYLALNVVYLVYFLFFHVSAYQDLIFIKIPLNIKVDSELARNLIYTFLEAALFAVVYSFYKFGVKSNSIYKKDHNLIIGIGGDSSVGKSTLLSDIKLLLGDRLLELEGDADHKWERGDENWQRLTHLNPKANHLHKQANDLLQLKHGKSVLRGDYDHAAGGFTRESKIGPREFIILSGLHTFYLPLTRKIIDFKIYMDTDERVRRHWKILRDERDRGYTKNKILEQIEKRLDDSKKFIHPQKDFADLTISYFVEKDFVAGDPAHNADLKLKLVLDSSIHIEELISRLSGKNVELHWDYADDLNRQYIILNNQPPKDVIINIARDLIVNIDEIAAEDVVWLDGYRGFVQLIVLMVLSEKMREKVGYED